MTRLAREKADARRGHSIGCTRTGEVVTRKTSYKRAGGWDVWERRRGQRFAGARDGLDLGRFELREALAPSHLISLGAQHLGHRPVAGRFHP